MSGVLGEGVVTPATLPVGEVRSLIVGGEDIVAVGSEPSGLAVVMCAADWALLQRFRLTRLRMGRYGVRAVDGPRTRLVVRFITGIDCSPDRAVIFRNGNHLDLRRSNVIVMSRGTLVNARRRNAVPCDISRFANGRKRPWNFVSAMEKVRAALDG